MDAGSQVTLDLAPLASDRLVAVVRSSRRGPTGFDVGLEFVGLPTLLRAHRALDLFETGLAPALQLEPPAAAIAT